MMTHFVCHYDSCACLFSAVVVFFHGFASSSFIFIGLTASGFRTTIIGAVIDYRVSEGDARFYIFRIAIGFITTSNRNFIPHK